MLCHQVVGDTAQLMCPILVKSIINFTKEREIQKREGLPQVHIGTGIMMAIGLFILTIVSSVGQNQVSKLFIPSCFIQQVP